MIEHQPSNASFQPQLEVQKQSYQVPSLEQHLFLNLTGVALSIGGFSTPNPFEELQ